MSQKMIDKNIYVTRPRLPAKEDFIKYIDQIWESRILTNNGPIHQQLEKAICEYLGVKYCSLFCNGTLALIVALQALRISGEVITTPFSFVATSHSLLWNGLTPVFCDIEENSCNMDTAKLEALITPKTTAIMPVHVYGKPCNIDEVQRIADIYGLKVIYDAAHAFGVEYKNESVCSFGDASVLSFHATKVFHTFEGGAIITNDENLKKRIDNLKNFGFLNETTIVGYGINAKMNEIQAAMGMLMLNEFEAEVANRKRVADRYTARLKDASGIRIFDLDSIQNHNYIYYPIFVDEKKYGMSRDELYDKLKLQNINTRRYFYPLISNIGAYQGLESAEKSKLTLANKVAEQVLCLPLYGDLESEIQDKILETIVK